MGRAAFLIGDLDPKITWVVKRLLKAGDTVLDVGANFGVISLLMSKLVGPTGRVLAFEPNPDLETLLACTFYKRDNIKHYPVALGETRSQMTLHIPRGNYGGASLLDATANFSHISHLVDVHKLDDILKSKTASHVSFMKLDVEGFEAKVLRGAAHTLQSDRPVVVFETSYGNCDALDLLAASDYRFLTLPRCMVWMKTKIFNYASGMHPKSHDVVAIPREQFDDIARVLRAN